MDMDKIPGAPVPTDIQSDSIEIKWKEPKYQCPNGSEYEVRYREVRNSKWIFYKETDQACIRVKGLKSGCNYKFRVRSVYGDFESQYSPESTAITTKVSPASALLEFTVKEKERKKGTPPIHRLFGTEIANSRNNEARTRKMEVGYPSVNRTFEKTILLVGETGSGKSTLVDALINYIAGVDYKDPYRLTLVDLEDDEEGKSQACSQTEWVTCYTINPGPGSRIPYTLNVIDTPGFGDTRGLDRDKAISEQLRKLFSSKGKTGVVFIDAVCFVMKAPDARLTSTQRYIFSSVLSLFGKDIKDNICALFTFADSKEPQVLTAVKEAKLPVELWYVFNNSGLFENNEDGSTTSAQFWEMGIDSFQKFFQGLKNMKTKSLQQTKEVLENRRKIEITISNLQPLIDVGLSKQEELRKEMLIVKEHESDIAAKRNFTYKVKETCFKKTDHPESKFATNCLNCKVTCHDDCMRTESSFMNYFCSAMCWSGNCTVCVGKCSYKEHTNERFMYRSVTNEVTKTYADQLEKYEAARKKKLTHEQYIEEMKKDINRCDANVFCMMEDVRQCKKKLSEIALQPNIISMEEYIDLMIKTAEMEKKEGFEERIVALNRHRKRIELEKVASSKGGFAAMNTVGNQETRELKAKK